MSRHAGAQSFAEIYFNTFLIKNEFNSHSGIYIYTHIQYLNMYIKKEDIYIHPLKQL